MPSTKDDAEPDLALTAAQRVDRLCAEFEREWRADRTPTIEPLVDPLQGPERKAALRELLAVEIEYLQKRGTVPRLEDYRARFPDEDEIVVGAFRDARMDVLVTRTFDADAPTRIPAEGVDATGALPAQFGNYELLREIARGGMGVVYEARPVGSERRVALKMILAGELATGEAVRRFRREAEAAAQLDHPHIVPIYEIGVAEGRHYFTMALVQGTTLGAELKKGSIDPRRAARLLEQIADAVHYAHGRGVVHRDLKPANVLLDRDGTPRVMDFGLARRLGPDASHDVPETEPDQVDISAAAPLRHADLTRTGTIMGTPAFMAPEQALAARAVGPAADVYSLGVILYALLTGRPPFLAATFSDLIRQLLNDEPVAPREIQRAIDPGLEAVCLKCLRKNPVDRYATACDLADDLRRFRAERPVTARGPTRSTPVADYLKTHPLLVPTAAGLLTYHLSSLFEAVFVVCLLAGMRLADDEPRPRGKAWLQLIVGFGAGAVLSVAAIASWDFWNWGPAAAIRETGAVSESPLPVVLSGGVLGMLVAWGAARLAVRSEETWRLRPYGWCLVMVVAGCLMIPALYGLMPAINFSSTFSRRGLIILWYAVPMSVVVFFALRTSVSIVDAYTDGNLGQVFIFAIGCLFVLGMSGWSLYQRQPFDWKVKASESSTTTATVLSATHGVGSVLSTIVWIGGSIAVGFPAGLAVNRSIRFLGRGRIPSAARHAIAIGGAGLALVATQTILLANLWDAETPLFGFGHGNAVEVAGRLVGLAADKPVPLFDWPVTLLAAALILMVAALLGAAVSRITRGGHRRPKP